MHTLILPALTLIANSYCLEPRTVELSAFELTIVLVNAYVLERVTSGFGWVPVNPERHLLFITTGLS